MPLVKVLTSRSTGSSVRAWRGACAISATRSAAGWGESRRGGCRPPGGWRRRSQTGVRWLRGTSRLGTPRTKKRSDGRRSSLAAMSHSDSRSSDRPGVVEGLHRNWGTSANPSKNVWAHSWAIVKRLRRACVTSTYTDLEAFVGREEAARRRTCSGLHDPADIEGAGHHPDVHGRSGDVEVSEDLGRDAARRTPLALASGRRRRSWSKRDRLGMFSVSKVGVGHRERWQRLHCSISRTTVFS